jgi:hypothetical protein
MNQFVTTSDFISVLISPSFPSCISDLMRVGFFAHVLFDIRTLFAAWVLPIGCVADFILR